MKNLRQCELIEPWNLYKAPPNYNDHLSHLVKREAQLLLDHLCACHNCDIFQVAALALTEARCLHSDNLQRAQILPQTPSIAEAMMCIAAATEPCMLFANRCSTAWRKLHHQNWAPLKFSPLYRNQKTSFCAWYLASLVTGAVFKMLSFITRIASCRKKTLLHSEHVGVHLTVWLQNSSQPRVVSGMRTRDNPTILSTKQLLPRVLSDFSALFAQLKAPSRFFWRAWEYTLRPPNRSYSPVAIRVRTQRPNNSVPASQLFETWARVATPSGVLIAAIVSGSIPAVLQRCRFCGA